MTQVASYFARDPMLELQVQSAITQKLAGWRVLRQIPTLPLDKVRVLARDLFQPRIVRNAAKYRITYATALGFSPSSSSESSMNDTLSALISPTLSMYGAAPVAQPAPSQIETSPAPRPSGATVLTGFAIATGVAAGVSALVGRVVYPETKTREFATVGALGYAIPAGVLLGVTALYRAQAK